MDIEYTQGRDEPDLRFNDLVAGDVFYFVESAYKEPGIADDEGGFTSLESGTLIEAYDDLPDRPVVRLSARLVIDGEDPR